MDEDERKKRMTVSLGTSFASEGLFICGLWEAQPCLWDPE